MNERTTDPRITIFIDRLQNLDAGGRARLRRMAGQQIGEAQEIGYFFSLLPPGVPLYQEQAYFLVATLFPMAESGSTGNLGHALQQARTAKNKKGLDRRVRYLLDSDDLQLPFRMRQTVRFLQSCRVRVDWTGLLEDLLMWDTPTRPVQRRWARSYFTE
jgi:CRISPR system Cascade subunit CasB